MSTDSHTWTSNTDLAAVATWLRLCRRVVVLTHVKPDGDAVGSSVAATRAINLALGGVPGREVAVPWYWGPLPDWMKDVIGPTAYRFIDEQNRAEHDNREDPDGVLIVDTGSWTQLHEVREWLLRRTDIAAVVDHHRQGDPDVAARRVIHGNAAAVCEPVAELCRLLLNVKSLRELPLEVAEPLYLGLATDTGWFRHSNVTPGVLRTAADLLEAGVHHSRLYQIVEQRDRVSRLKLMARALSSMELHDRDRVAVLTLTLKDFHDCHAASTDSAGFSELALTAEKVQVCVLITEAFVHEGDGSITKVSMRSKEGPDAVDVNAAAKALGGGGHIRDACGDEEAGLGIARREVVSGTRA